MKRILALMLIAGSLYAQDSASVVNNYGIYSGVRALPVLNTNNTFRDVTLVSGGGSVFFPVYFDHEVIRTIKLRVKVSTNENTTYRIELRNRDSSKVVPISFSGIVSDTTLESSEVSFSTSTRDTFKLYAKAASSTGDLFIYYASFDRRAYVTTLATTDSAVYTTITRLKDSMTVARALVIAKLSIADTATTAVITQTELNSALTAYLAQSDTTGVKIITQTELNSALTGYLAQSDTSGVKVTTQAEMNAALGAKADTSTFQRDRVLTSIDNSADGDDIDTINVSIKDTDYRYVMNDDGIVVLNGDAVGVRNRFYIKAHNQGGFQVTWRGYDGENSLLQTVIPSPAAGTAAFYWITVEDTLVNIEKGDDFPDPLITVVADTAVPEAPSLLLASNTSSRASIEVINPVGPPGVRSNIIKVSPNIAIGDTTVTGALANYPTMTIQDLSVPVFTSAVSSMDVTLPTVVDPTKSFVTLPTFQASLDEPRITYLKAYLSTDGTKVTISKSSTSGSTRITNIRFSVVTANKWMTVQHLPFSSAIGVSSSDVTMTTIDQSKSFPILSMVNAASDMSMANFPTVHFTSNTNARVTYAGTLGSAISGVVQVVTIDSAAVQAFELTLGVGDTTAMATLSPAVTVNRSFSVMTYRPNNVSLTDAGKLLLMGNIDSTTGYSVRRDHASSNPSLVARAYIVTFNSGWPIVTQRTLMSYAAGATSGTGTITDANTSRTFVWSTGHYGKSGITAATTDTTVSAMFSIYQSDSVTITTSRNGGPIARLRVETITFPDGGGAGVDTVAFDSLEVATGTFDTVSQFIGDKLYFRFDVQPSTPYYVRAKAVGVNDSISDMSVQLAFTTPATPVVANNGDWFVDFDDGSDAAAGTSTGAPFATLSKALTVAQPGDTIRISDTCEVQTTFSRDNGSNPIVIKSYTGSMAVINISGSTIDGFVFASGSGGYVVDSVRFNGGRYQISGERSIGVRIKSCYFYNGLGFGQIHMRGVSGWIIQNNTFDKNDRVRYNGVDEDGMGDCIYMTSYRDVTPFVLSTRNLIEYNIITNGGHAGILLTNGADKNRIRGNTVYQCKSLITNINGAKENVWEDNVGYWPATFGMMAGHTGGGIQMLGDKCIWRGNTIYRDTTVSTTPVAGTSWLNSFDTRLHASNGTTVYHNRNNRIYNNTFVNDIVGTSPLNTVLRTDKWTETGIIQDMRFTNNIIVGEDSIIYYHDNKYETAASQTVIFAYNMFARFPHDTGKKIIRIGSTSGIASYTLTQAKSSVGNMILASNVENDPLFSDATNNDFSRSASSPANSAGGPLTTAKGAGTNSSILEVNEAYWFSDGQQVVDGDLIFMQGWTSPARVIGIDGTILSLSTPKTWSDGAGIYFGSSATPNMGAD